MFRTTLGYRLDMAKRTKRRITEAERALCRDMGARIRQARLAAGLNAAAALAEPIGVTYQQVLKYENGQNWPSTYTLTLIAKITRKPLAYFLEGAEGRPSELPAATISMTPGFKALSKAGAEATHAMTEFLSIPMVEGQIAGGTPLEVEDHIVGWVLIHRGHLRGRQRSGLQAVRLKGKSMEPILRDGAVLVVDCRDRAFVPHGIYAIRTSDGCTAKYAVQRGHHLILWQENGEEICDFPQCVDLRIEENPLIGRVVWCWQPLV